MATIEPCKAGTSVTAPLPLRSKSWRNPGASAMAVYGMPLMMLRDFLLVCPKIHLPKGGLKRKTYYSEKLKRKVTTPDYDDDTEQILEDRYADRYPLRQAWKYVIGDIIADIGL
ncbi:MAG: hypothetical protein ACOWYE_15180 [Desulfatiglandales bacterium]